MSFPSVTGLYTAALGTTQPQVGLCVPPSTPCEGIQSVIRIMTQPTQPNTGDSSSNAAVQSSQATADAAEATAVSGGSVRRSALGGVFGFTRGSVPAPAVKLAPEVLLQRLVSVAETYVRDGASEASTVQQVQELLVSLQSATVDDQLDTQTARDEVSCVLTRPAVQSLH